MLSSVIISHHSVMHCAVGKDEICSELACTAVYQAYIPDACKLAMCRHCPLLSMVTDCMQISVIHFYQLCITAERERAVWQLVEWCVIYLLVY